MKFLKKTIALVEENLKITRIILKKTFFFCFEIFADPEALNQVFLNIILNSIDAILEGGKISITTVSNIDAMIISISDTGCGIPKENLDKFSIHFYYKKIGKGTGLGLAISLGIIKEHSGSITVESELSKGSKFTIILPKNSNG